MKTIRLFILLTLVSGAFSTQAQSFLRQRQHMRAAINLLYDEDEEMEEEDSIRGFFYGLNIGSYFGNKESAALYNGSGAFDGFINEASNVYWFSIDERIGPNSGYLQDIQAINTFYNSTGYELPFDSYPTNMRYNPAFSVGLQMKYHFNRYSALVMNLNGIRMNAGGQFTIRFYGTPQPINAQADVRLFNIVGKEQRFNLNLGYRQGWMMGDFSNLYLQFGGSMLGTQYMENQIQIANRTIGLVSSPPIPGQNVVTAQSQTGIGFGGYFSAGIEFWLGKYSFDLSFGMSRDKVKIFTYEKTLWNKWLQLSFMI